MKNSDFEYFRNLLRNMREEIQQKGENTIEDMTEDREMYADPADRASAESDRAFILRLRDRDRKLIYKIDQALDRIDEGSFGICDECGEDISIPRLKARPVTTLCIKCKSRQEQQEAMQGD
ncbi:RNA polymerase-binding protein DksA [Desulfonatronovibrio hydrogenovorans]|uniref:RNA polymerase-binding protein DksA n=1 Tax=Desulfonatronovibrio hydrogenovorans TaxID=53245 RepID=UPI00048AFBA8|nr:RNA polymerase-binding protein DksA [Desulfonatronovibrio hydrogenovorans]